jgi:ClpP class serine protease
VSLLPNWSQVLEELKTEDAKLVNSQTSTFDIVRKRYLASLCDYTGRNVIAYYSGWLSKPYSFGMEVQDDDRNGFMMAVHGLDKTRGLDLFLHTPGGDIAAAESLVHYLRQIFGNNIRAIVPQIAMSAGTMLACSCKSIVMAKHSNLGPIDPQISGIPAAAVKEEFEEAIRQISKDQSRLAAWQFILSKYTPTYLAACENAVEWSKEFVKRELEANMLSHLPDKSTLADVIVGRLSDFTGNKSHSRHLHSDACEAMGLIIESLEVDSELQDKILTVHHCFMHTLANSGAIKIIESQSGTAYVKVAGT